MPDIKLEPNSHRSKRDIPQVTKGKVIDRKKSLGRKFAEAFIEDDMENIQDYILYEVAAPSIKKAIFDAIVGALQMILGVNSAGKSTSSSSTGHTSYRSFYASDRSKGTVSAVSTKPKKTLEVSIPFTPYKLINVRKYNKHYTPINEEWDGLRP